MSYWNDHRVTASDRRWYKTLDSARNRATILMYNDEDEEEEKTVAIAFEVCPCCAGRGSHVNPSIDSHGLSREDFDEDPDFAEAYFSGAYDQTCNECGGQNVVPVPADPKIREYIAERAREAMEYRRECEAERRMGA